ncbi:MAG TPA: permease [Candidatus Hydrogenedentes bacterium]|nr:permease [Candidatus Hydrogenedentota bacterium]
MDMVVPLISACWLVLGQMAPYLLFGFLMAGVLSVAITPEWVERHLGGRGFGPVFKSSLFGIPLPLCSCGVIPVMASIRRHGAGRGATVGFLLSTPQTGVDSIFATYALLGPVLAVYRPLVALVTGVVGGLAAQVFDPDRSGGETDASGVPACTASCCSDGPRRGLVARALEYGFVTLSRDIAKPLFVGILIAGAMSVFIQENFLSAYLGGGLVAMLVMMAMGIPIYVCSTASIPIALGFMHMGASPGAALVFLISGPATNAAAISVVWQLLGRRTAIIYLVTAALGALLAGISLDALYNYLPPAMVPMAHHAEAHASGWVGNASAVALLIILLASLLEKRPAVVKGETAGKEGVSAMTDRIIIRISGMTCSHCVNTIARALRQTSGVREATVDLDSGQAVVSGEDLDTQTLLHAIRDLGYEASLADS